MSEVTASGCVSSHRALTGRSQCLAVLLCVTLVPCAALAAPSNADPAKTEQRTTQHWQSAAGPAGKQAPRVHAGMPARVQTHGDVSRLSRTATDPQNRVVMTAPSPARPTENKRVAPAARGTVTIAQAHSAAGVSGSAVGRRAAGATVVGGPAKYDARNGAVIDGSQVRRRSRTG